MTIEEIKDTIQTWIRTADDEYDREEMGRVYGLKSALHLIEKLDVPDTNAGDLISRQEVSDIIKTRLYQTALNNTECITSYDKACEDIAENRIDTWINEAKSVESEQNLQPTCNQLATDCISRQELLNAISQKEYGHDYDKNTDILGLKYVDIIKGMPSVKLETCGDCVSRQAVLDLAKCGRLVSNGNYKSVCDAINGLPSVEPAENDVLSAENAENIANSGTKTDKSDLISRKEFLKRIEPYNTDDKMDKALYNFAYDKMMDCSSVEPERKPGKWIDYPFENVCGQKLCDYRCNLCAYFVNAKTKFCPNCGAKMEVDG